MSDNSINHSQFVRVNIFITLRTLKGEGTRDRQNSYNNGLKGREVYYETNLSKLTFVYCSTNISNIKASVSQSWPMLIRKV